MKYIYVARYDSLNFSFEAFGVSAETAEAALLVGLAKHQLQYQLEADWFHSDDIHVTEHEVGSAYRDYERI